MRDAQEEHQDDPRDLADALAILDGVPVRLDCCQSCMTIPCACDDFGLEPARERWRRPAPRIER